MYFSGDMLKVWDKKNKSVILLKKINVFIRITIVPFEFHMHV